MRYWLYPQYYGGGKGPTLRGCVVEVDQEKVWISEGDRHMSDLYT